MPEICSRMFSKMLVFGISYCFISLNWFCFSALFVCCAYLPWYFIFPVLCLLFILLCEANSMEYRKQTGEKMNTLCICIELLKSMKLCCYSFAWWELNREDLRALLFLMSPRLRLCTSVADYRQQEIIHNFCTQTFLLLLYCSTFNFYVFWVHITATLSPRGMNAYVADKVVLKDVIFTGDCLVQIQGIAFIRVLNMSYL